MLDRANEKIWTVGIHVQAMWRACRRKIYLSHRIWHMDQQSLDLEKSAQERFQNHWDHPLERTHGKSSVFRWFTEKEGQITYYSNSKCAKSWFDRSRSSRRTHGESSSFYWLANWRSQRGNLWELTICDILPHLRVWPRVIVNGHMDGGQRGS
jgi:hypothetical protein